MHGNVFFLGVSGTCSIGAYTDFSWLEIDTLDTCNSRSNEGVFTSVDGLLIVYPRPEHILQFAPSVDMEKSIEKQNIKSAAESRRWNPKRIRTGFTLNLYTTHAR